MVGQTISTSTKLINIFGRVKQSFWDRGSYTLCTGEQKMQLATKLRQPYGTYSHTCKWAPTTPPQHPFARAPFYYSYLGTLHAFGLLWLGFKIGPKLVGGWILSLLLCTSSSRRAIPPSKYVPHPGWMCYLEFGRKSLYSQISSKVLSWEDKCLLVLYYKKKKRLGFKMRVVYSSERHL